MATPLYGKNPHGFANVVAPLPFGQGVSGALAILGPASFGAGASMAVDTVRACVIFVQVPPPLREKHGLCCYGNTMAAAFLMRWPR